MNLFRWWKGREKINSLIGDKPQSTKAAVDDRPSPISDYCIADHLVVMRLGNSHHGIYSGEGRVIYYNYYAGVIVESRLEDYSKGTPIKVVYSPVSFKSSMVISRARSRVGEREHNLYQNHSEQFVRWARGGGLF